MIAIPLSSSMIMGLILVVVMVMAAVEVREESPAESEQGW